VSLTLLKQLQKLNEDKDYMEVSLLTDSAEKYLGQIYAKLGNTHQTLKQQDINPKDLALVLSGFRVLGKSDLRSGFSDIAKPKSLLKILNDINEPGRTKEFGENDIHKMDADERLKDIGQTASKFVTYYEDILNRLEEDNDDEEAREILLRDIGKMRTFFEQLKNKLKFHLGQAQPADFKVSQTA
jgi:hypothetical protein